MTMLHVRGARVRFGDSGTVTLPDLRVDSGERLAIVGANGSGKSTLLRVLAGVLRADGNVDRGCELAAVAWIAQRPYLFRTSVADNVALALVPLGLPAAERRRRALMALDDVGVADLADRSARALSDGQVVRVAVARALVAGPRVLLLDETLAPLDADATRRVASAILAVPGLTVVAASPTAAGLAALRPTRTTELPSRATH